jgi:hypothetical protein
MCKKCTASNPNTLTGLDPFGPFAKEFDCTQYATTVIGQAADKLPRGDLMSSTCLHIAMKGPLGKHGAVVPQPFSGRPVTVAAVGVEFDRHGGFVGAQRLHYARDLKTCIWEAHDVIDSNQRDGKVPLGNSLLIYCVPIPGIPTKTSDGLGDDII